MPKPTATQATGDQTTDRGGPEVLTAVEAAALLGLNERTIRRAIDRGELPAIRRGRSFAIEPEALEGFRQHYVPDAPPVPSALLHARTLSSSRQESGLHAESAGQAADASLLVGLPHLLTRFIGRERELAALTARLDAGERLVTLTGLGGIGKSRLALAAASEAAPRFADGAAFVALAPVRSADQVLPAILLALGEREGDDRSPLERLTSLLQPRHVLLLLDNVEHVLGVGPALAELLAACPRLTIVATSRSALRIAGERPFPVAPLSLPEVASAPVPVAAISATEAVQLFVDRARIVDDTFALSDSNAAAVAAICRRLDGLPLAIELAAARSAILPPHALLARLEQRLPLLSGGPRDQPDRLQTMRGALTWSEDLLDPQQQSLLHRLAVFVGGIPLSAAEYVGGQGGSSGLDRDSLPSILNSLAGLLESGLLLRAEATGGEPRFAMLEIVREYALDRLVATGEEAATRHAHADWYLAFAEDAQLALWTATDEALLTRLETEHDNFRTALGWAIAAEPNVALRLAGSLAQFWTKRSYWTEGRDWLERALAAGDAGESEARAVALGRLGMLATDQGDYDMARRHLEASLAMADHLELDGSAARARRGLGIVASHRSEFALAMEHFAAALARFRALGDQAGIARCLNDLGLVASRQGDLAQAIAYQEEALPINRTLGDEWQLSIVLGNLGGAHYDHGNRARGEALTEEALTIAERLGDTFGIAVNGYNLGCYALIEGDATTAASRFRDVLRLTQVLGERHLVSRVIDRVGAALALDRQPRLAARLFGAAAALRESLGDALFAEEDADLSARFAAVRTELSEEIYNAAWETGRSLPFAVAVAEATKLATTLAATSPKSSVFGLTPRESEVLRLMAEGQSDKEIAITLFVARSTASKHVAAVIAKLGVDSRTAAVSAAHRHRLV